MVLVVYVLVVQLQLILHLLYHKQVVEVLVQHKEQLGLVILLEVVEVLELVVLLVVVVAEVHQ